MSIPAGYKGNQWGWFYKESDNSGPYFLDADGFMAQGFPKKLFTDFNHEYARLRVDVGQTGFFAGREFRAFNEFSIGTGGSVTYRLSCPVEMILHQFTVLLTIESIRVEVYTDSTEGGTFTGLPVFKTNGMSTAPAYVGQATLAKGGTITGGTLRDLLLIDAGPNDVQAKTQAIEINDPIGRSAIPLYIKIINLDTGTATGILRLRWEERPLEP